jgi:hypothetical protein
MRRHISADNPGIKRLVLQVAVVRQYKYKKIRKITSISDRLPNASVLFIDAQAAEYKKFWRSWRSVIGPNKGMNTSGKI